MASIFKKKPNVKNRLAEYGATAQGGKAPKTATNRRAEVSDRIERALKGRGFAQTVQRNLARADLKLTVAEFLGIKLLCVAIGFAIGVFLGRGFAQFSIIVGIVVAVVAYMIPDIVVKNRGNKRIKDFNNQLGDTITLMANSLRSGYSLLQSMELVSREAPAPMNDEFGRVIREVSLGIPTREALANMLRRVPSDDLDLLITAIGIQMEVGGNLAQVLDNIGHTIRERVRIKGEIRVLTAQQKYAGYIISGLPVALALVLMLIAPSFMFKLFVWPWICMPICALILIAVGFWAIMKIVDIDV
jgi:tight adherence protein B